MCRKNEPLQHFYFWIDYSESRAFSTVNAHRRISVCMLIRVFSSICGEQHEEYLWARAVLYMFVPYVNSQILFGFQFLNWWCICSTFPSLMPIRAVYCKHRLSISLVLSHWVIIHATFSCYLDLSAVLPLLYLRKKMNCDSPERPFQFKTNKK